MIDGEAEVENTEHTSNQVGQEIFVGEGDMVGLGVEPGILDLIIAYEHHHHDDEVAIVEDVVVGGELEEEYQWSQDPDRDWQDQSLDVRFSGFCKIEREMHFLLLIK